MKKILFIRGRGQYFTTVADTASQAKSFVELLGSNRRQNVYIKVRAQIVVRADDFEKPDVLVTIKGHDVGHLSAEDARALMRVVRYGERSKHEIFECAALIRGNGNDKPYDVTLDLGFED